MKPECVPEDWGYGEYWLRPATDAIAYDHSADEPTERVSWKIVATVVVAAPIVMYLVWCIMLGVARTLAGVS